MVIVFIQQLIEKFLIGCRTYIFANDIYIYNIFNLLDFIL